MLKMTKSTLRNHLGTEEESLKALSTSTVVRYTKVSGLITCVTDTVNNSGLTIPAMKACGVKEKQMATENFSTLTAMFMKVNGLMIKLMDTELIPMPTAQSTLECGKTINNMEVD
jgi:hypothetical protein